MKKVSRKIILDMPTKIGIFASSLLVATTAVYIWSPIIGSHADDNQTTEISATINPVASVTLDTNNLVFNIAPTNDGVFRSSPIIATVKTNSTGGYELYFSSENNDTDMVHSNPSIPNVISSDFEGAVTSATMAKEKWGYSLDNIEFLKIPTAANQIQLRDIDHFPSAAEQNNTVYIGTKISSSLPSGTYSKNIVFSVLAHESPVPHANRLIELTSMQDPNLSVYCADTYTPTKDANVGTADNIFYGDLVPQTTLADNRGYNNNTYVIKKLADGKCWMTENLRIVNKTISAADSNLQSGETWTIPASSISGFNAQNTNDAYLDSTYGGYYTFYTATAGWGTDNVTSGNSPRDICPKGWRLPTTRESSSDFKILRSYYDSLELMMGAPGFIYSSRIFENRLSVNNAGETTSGHFWSSSSMDNSAAWSMGIYKSGSSVSTDNRAAKTWGLAIRCVAN